jgi:hypothetical protein
VFRVFVALVVTLTAVSTALLLSATPVLAQEDPNTTEQASAPSPERDRSSQPAPDRSFQLAPDQSSQLATEPAPTDSITVPAPTDTVTVPAVSVPAVSVPAPTDTVTVPAPTDTTTEHAEPVGGSSTAPVPPSEPTFQPSLESMPGLGAAPARDPTPSTSADNLAAAAAQIYAEGASKEKVLIEQVEQVGDLVTELLGGNGSSGSLQGLMEHVANAVGDLVQAISGMLDGLLGGDYGAPAPVQVVGDLVSMLGDLTRAPGEALDSLEGVGVVPAPAAHYLSVQPLAAFYYDYEQTSTELMGRTAAAVGELAQAVGRVPSGSGGVAPNQAGVPATPAAPPPVPGAPPVLPVGYSSSLLVASGSAADAFQLLFAVLALFSIALLQGGRLSWLRRESHAPPTAVVLAIERPG